MDPLRPFTDLIRSLRAAGKLRATRTVGAAKDDSSPVQRTDTQPVEPAASVTSLLRAKLALLDDWNEARVRELFVEHVLLSELGNDLSRDPGFVDLVRRVSTQLGSEPRISARLDQLLRQLVQDSSHPRL